ncbi:MAG: glutaredoxin family protein [Halobacteriota archaeon]
MIPVPGEYRGDVKLYALSTCRWCQKIKQLFRDLGLQYEYTDMDLLLEDEATQSVKEDLQRHNPSCSLPTLVINRKECIVGYDKEKIKKSLKELDYDEEDVGKRLEELDEKEVSDQEKFSVFMVD